MSDKRMTITIEDPDHVRLPLGATVKIGNNDELKKNKLEQMPGVWQVVRVHLPEEGKQKYDVDMIGLNRKQLRAFLKTEKMQ
jgi:hypothetical protein